MNNPCIECGKQRVEGRTWKEKMGSSIIINTMTICPDPACQKIVDKKVADRKAKTALLSKERAQAKLAREKLLAAS